MASSTRFRSTIIFAALTVAGVLMAVVAPAVAPTADTQVLSDFGAALFGGGLAFYLVDMVSLERQRTA